MVGIERGWPAVLAVSSERCSNREPPSNAEYLTLGELSPPRKKKSRLYGRMRIGHLFLTGSSHGRDISSFRPFHLPPSSQSPTELNFYR